MLSVIFLCSANLLQASLAGNYTIDASKKASATNYTSFNDADSDLTLGSRASKGTANGPGISATTIFKVAAGTYTEQVDLGSISGTSSTSMVIFDGGAGNASTRTLTYSGTSGTSYTVRFDGCEYVQFRNMTLEGTGSAAWVVHFLSSSNNSIANCIVQITGSGASSSSSDFICVLLNGSSSSYQTSYSYTGNSIDTCKITSGFCGIYGYNTNGSNLNYFHSDTIVNSYNAGLYCNGSQTVKILHNTITPRSGVNNDGIVLFNDNSSITGDHSDIGYNIISNAGYRGIYMATSNGASSGYGEIHDNTIGGGFRSKGGCYGIYTTSGHWRLTGNTIYMDIATTSLCAAYYQDIVNNVLVFRNNHFIVAATGTSSMIPFYCYNSSAIDTLDNNNYYNGNASTLVKIGSLSYTAANYKSGKFNKNSYAVNPSFVSTTDFTPQNGCITGVYYNSFPVDLNGKSRTNPPSIGAIESAGGRNNDIGIIDISSPSAPLSTGSTTIKVLLKNYGKNTITSASLNYQVNGGSVVSESWSGSIGACDTVSYSFTTKFNVTAITNSFVAYTKSPNGVRDVDSTNDTFTKIISVSLKGGYIINNTGVGTADFLSFSAAATALNTGSVTGPVTFTVVTSTYNEQVYLGQIIGSSSTNRITFQSQSGKRGDVILNYNSPSSGNYVWKIDGTDYLSIKNMTVQSLNSNYGTIFDINGGATYDSLYNDSLQGYPLTYTYANQSHCLVYSGSPGSDPTIKNEYNTFANNAFVDGSYGVYFAGYTNSTWLENGQVFTNNTFIDQDGYGLYLQFQSAPVVSNNSIATTATNTNYAAIYMFYAQNGTTIVKNKISGIPGGYGIYVYYSAGSSSAANLFANNFIQVGDPATTNAAYGIYIYNSPYQNVYNNSVNITSGSTASSYNSYAFYFTTNTSSTQYIDIKDNVFANTGDGSSNAGQSIYLSDPTLVTCDYNDLWAGKGGSVGYLGSTSSSYSNLSGWQLASSLDSNSVSVNPQFTSASDLHSKAAGINNKAIPLALVTDDIDGQARSTTTPDIGADEFTPPISLDASVNSIDTPVANFCVGSNPVVVTVTNNGSITLTSAIVNWTVNGTAQTAYSWTGTLTSGNSVQLTLGKYTFSKGAYKIVAWTSKPNSAKDSNTTNDTATKANLYDGISGSYTIDGNTATGGTNYQTFTDAVADLTLHGVCGAVTYGVKDNDYNEQIIIGKIAGASATNNITFKSTSGHSAQTLLEYSGTNSSSTDNYVLDMRGASWVTFKQITIMRGGYFYYGGDIILEKGASNNSFINDSIIGSDYPNTNSTSALVYSPTDVDSNNLFSGNIMKYGSFGFYMMGTGATALESKTVIKNNLIDSAYYIGIYMSNELAPVIAGNIISNLRASYANGINFSSNIYEHTIVSKNQIYLPSGGYGMYFGYGSIISNNGDTAIISNNFIAIEGSGSNTNYGIQAYCNSNSTTYCNFYYNSISIDNSGSGSVGMQLYSYSYAFTLYNNAIENQSGGYAIYFQSGSSTVTDMNYNDLYTTGSNVGDYNGSTEAKLTDWQTATGFDGNSISVDPKYTSISDLHTSNASLKAGVPLSNVLDDIDGDKRSTTTPIIGADEFSTVSDDVSMFAIINPSSGACGNAKATVTVVIKDIGSNSESSIPVRVSVNGATALTGTTSKTITTGQTDTFTFATTVNTIAGGSFSIKAWTALSTDGDRSNDTLKNSVTINAVPTAAFSAKGACNGNAANFTDASKNATSYNYKFGDGGTSTSASPTYTYAKTGTFTVTQIASNGSCIDSVKHTVNIHPNPSVVIGMNGLCTDPLQFKDSSTISSGTVTTWAWRFGDGKTASTQNPTHSYTTFGTTTIVLVATSDSGCADSASRVINVDKVPTGIFTHVGTGGRNYKFTSNDSTGTLKYSWDFGDSTGFVTTRNSTHNYAKDGNRSVSLIVTNSNGCKASTTDTVNVMLTGIESMASSIDGINIYPNPFSNEAHIDYTLANATHVRVELCDLTGRNIAVLADNQQTKGSYTISFNPAQYSSVSGVYILKMTVGESVNTYKLIRLK